MYDLSLGSRLKFLREKAKMTQTEVGLALGVSQSTYVRYEQNKINRYKKEVFDTLAELFGCTVEYLLGEENSDPRYAHLPDYLQTFIRDPEAAPFIAEAYLAQVAVKVRQEVVSGMKLSGGDE